MNFKTIIDELCAAGMTQTQIGEACGCSQGAISDLQRGESQQPRYSVGKALIDLHAERVKAATESATAAG